MTRVLGSGLLALALIVGSAIGTMIAPLVTSAQVTIQRGFGPTFPFGATTATASGVLTVNTTQAATGANTTETDLWTYSLPANSLSADGKTVRITAYVLTAANANNKTVKLYFGSQLVNTTTAVALNAGLVQLQMDVTRTAAATQELIGKTIYGAADGSAITAQRSDHINGTQDTTTAITIKVTGQNGTAAANDIVFRSALVEALN